MEASALTHASRGGLLRRRTPLLKLQGDERLVALIRDGEEHAFEVLFDRYHSRLLAFCRHMLRSTEDAEDVLQEVFVKAHAAMLADERHINARPWLYRIARNRCLNHLRRPVPEGQDTMDVMPADGGVTTAERVQKREDFRALIDDVGELPETQRTALLLREIDALSYEEIAAAMDTTVPAVKSLLVRARMSLAEASQSRHLTCGEVRLELAEAAEGLRKASGPARYHLKRCEECQAFRTELRDSSKALAALAPLGPLALLHNFIISKLSGLFGGSSSAAGGGAVAGGGAAAGGTAAIGGGATAVGTGGVAGAGVAAAGAAGGGGAMFSGVAAAGGIGGAIGAKAAATAATAALLTAGAVEVRQIYSDKTDPAPAHSQIVDARSTPPAHGAGHALDGQAELHTTDATATETDAPGATDEVLVPETEPVPPTPVSDPAAPESTEEAAVGPPGGSSTHGNDDSDQVTVTVITPTGDAPGAVVTSETVVPVGSTDPGATTPPSTTSTDTEPTTSPDTGAAG
jgi:RNA polymerase sigma factor (sigma-70 family)